MTASRWEVLDGYRVQPWVQEPGAGSPVLRTALSVPAWDAARPALPSLVWDGHPAAERAFDRAWELAWQHLRTPQPGPFSAPFLDSAFNGNVFLWDAAFAQRFMVYARRVLDVALLDGFYAGQAEDGWICRTMTPEGHKVWERHDPSSTGPNVAAWVELTCAERTGDLERLAYVLPSLLAYHRWMQRYRRWPSGGYWSTGWGSGMDALPRLPQGADPNFEHARVTWVDATLQALLSLRSLLRIAELTESSLDLSDLFAEQRELQALVDGPLWDDQLRAYTDLWPDGSSAGTLHIGTFWSLLACDPSPDRLAHLVGHLSDPAQFGRPFPVPALAASHPAYRADGGYWLGGVWTPTTLMVLDGLRVQGHPALAHALGRQHLELVAEVVEDTGTIWENYAPERAEPGHDARPDFVGWGGASVITVGIEHLVGISTSGHTIRWDVRLLERHGINRLPVGPHATVDLRVAARSDASERPVMTASADMPVRIELAWSAGSFTVDVLPEETLARH